MTALLSRTAFAASVAACAADAPATSSDDDQAAGHAGVAEGDDDFKGCPAGSAPFEPGLQAAGDHFSVKVLAAMPAAPQRYSNNWTVELDQLDGSPDADAQIKRSQTFMPVHGHDGRVVPKVSALPGPGQFQVDGLTFTMRGPWEVRFWLSGAGVDEDYVVLQVCVEK